MLFLQFLELILNVSFLVFRKRILKGKDNPSIAEIIKDWNQKTIPASPAK
jgi:hypothetical protein